MPTSWDVENRLRDKVEIAMANLVNARHLLHTLTREAPLDPSANRVAIAHALSNVDSARRVLAAELDRFTQVLKSVTPPCTVRTPLTESQLCIRSISRTIYLHPELIDIAS
jgi:hypothetical protein